MNASTPVCAVLLLSLAGCAGGSPTSSVTAIAVGIWGGDHVRLTVESNAVSVEFDCAHGTLPAPVPLDDGAFDVTGILVLERGGPIREGEVLPQQTARYSGTVEGADMTLRVTLVDTAQVTGDYTLRRGAAARLFKCL